MKTIILPLDGDDQLRPLNDEQLAAEMRSRDESIESISTRTVRGRVVEVRLHCADGCDDPVVEKSARAALKQHVPAPVQTVRGKLRAAKSAAEKMAIIETLIERRFGEDLWNE